MTFEESDLAAIAGAREIRIETQSAAGEAHRTIIWVAALGDTVYLRSVNGAGARWYREATAPGRPVAIVVDGRRLPVTVAHASDDASIEACSEALTAKYQRSYSLQAMLMPHTLETTLRVAPARTADPAVPADPAEVPA